MKKRTTIFRDLSLLLCVHMLCHLQNNKTSFPLLMWLVFCLHCFKDFTSLVCDSNACGSCTLRTPCTIMLFCLSAPFWPDFVESHCDMWLLSLILRLVGICSIRVGESESTPSCNRTKRKKRDHFTIYETKLIEGLWDFWVLKTSNRHILLKSISSHHFVSFPSVCD